jgi:hypothetical protein
MLRKTILLCASVLALHATAVADQNDQAPPEGQVAPPPPKPLCTRSEKLEQVAQVLADLQHIPPSSELVQTAREEGIDANPVYA